VYLERGQSILDHLGVLRMTRLLLRLPRRLSLRCFRWSCCCIRHDEIIFCRFSQRTKKLSTSQRYLSSTNVEVTVLPPTRMRGYKANARTSLRQQQLRVRSRRYFVRLLRFSVFVWSNSRFNSVSRGYRANSIPFHRVPRKSWLSLRTTVMVFMSSPAALWSFKASRVGVWQKAPAQFNLIFADFCKNYSKLTTDADRAIFPLH